MMFPKLHNHFREFANASLCEAPRTISSMRDSQETNRSDERIALHFTSTVSSLEASLT
jgi:hypothetical protein